MEEVCQVIRAGGRFVATGMTAIAASRDLEGSDL
jgi:hypothetical protein